MKAANIPTAVHYPIPLNKQPAVRDDGVSLPVGDSIAQHVISLPMHPYLKESTIIEITEAISTCHG
ncbi:UDP-2-acetamido-2-deoxy-3-oxo-D-glucuronate aminotransferase [compost metagenome]